MVIMVIMDIMDIMVYYHTSHDKQEKVDKVFYRFIGFSFSVYHFHFHDELIYIYIHTFPVIRTEHFYNSFIMHGSLSHCQYLPLSITSSTSLIKLALLQLHHRTSLTIIMLITHDPLTPISRGLLKFTTRAHYIHDTFFKLPLFHSNIPFHSPVLVLLQIRPVSQLPCLSLTFPLPIHKSSSSPISKYIWNTSTLFFSPTTSTLTQVRDQLIKTQCFVAYVPTKPTAEFNRIWHPPALLRIAMHDAIKHVMVYLFIKLAMQKTLVTL